MRSQIRTDAPRRRHSRLRQSLPAGRGLGGSPIPRGKEAVMTGGRRVLALIATLLLLVTACGDRSETGAADTTEEDVAAGTDAAAEDTEEETEGDAGGGGELGTIKVGLLNPTTGVFAALGADTNTGF